MVTLDAFAERKLRELEYTGITFYRSRLDIAPGRNRGGPTYRTKVDRE